MRRHSISFFNRFTLVPIATLVLLFSSALDVTSVQAAGILVNSHLDVFDPADGLCTLREAIIAANSDTSIGSTAGECAPGSGADVISFADDYTITLDGQQLPPIRTEITLTGHGADKTIIQASTCNPVTLPGNCTPATYRVFRISDGFFTLDQVSVRNGHCDGLCSTEAGHFEDRYYGGAILLTGDSSLTVTNSTFSGNSATYGGAIATRRWPVGLAIHNSTFFGNSAREGGAIDTERVSMTVSGSFFSDNSANQGGAIDVEHTLATVTNSTFIANSASNFGGTYVNPAMGGGICVRAGSSLILANNTISGNSATYGGGIANQSNASLVLVNSTITGNSATAFGGGILNAATLTITSNTIAENSAANGGGLANDSDLLPQGTVTVTNTIIANNPSGGNCAAVIINGGNNLDSGSTCNWGTRLQSMSDTDPRLGPIADNGGPTQTYALLDGSPAINTGNAAVCSGSPVNGMDQRQVTRPQGIRCDIGAFEKETPLAYTFGDVPANYWAWDYIERLYNAGITGGCTTHPLQYCPERTVTRAQIAVFLLRGLFGSSYVPPSVEDSTGFDDVPIDYWAAAWIKQLALEGITGGCGSGNYCPEATVTRAQMAVLLLRAKHGASYTPPGVGAGTGFTDVRPAHWAAVWIKQLVAEGITSGCGAGRYCPGLPVTRAQMAVFLVRIFNLS